MRIIRCLKGAGWLATAQCDNGEECSRGGKKVPTHRTSDTRSTWRRANPLVGSSAVVGPSCVVAGKRRRGGGEDPWLCGPGFRWVCLCRGWDYLCTVGYRRCQAA